MNLKSILELRKSKKSNTNQNHLIFFEYTSSEIKKICSKFKNVPKPILGYDLERGFKPSVEGNFDLPEIPSQLALANYSTFAETEEFASELAKMAQFVGLNTIFAPVLDVNSNPNNPIINLRSFGSNPKTVAEFGKSFIRGIQKNGVVACAKHFPGHGNTDLDSHTGLVQSDSDKDFFEQTDLLPFKAAISENVGMVMNAHISFPKFSENKPASLSPYFLTEILRTELGFDGVLTTDAFSYMAGIGEGDNSELCVESLLAGTDIILMPENPERVEELAKKKISQEKLLESEQRIEFLRKNFSAFNSELPKEFDSNNLNKMLNDFWGRVVQGVSPSKNVLVQTNDTEKDLWLIDKFFTENGFKKIKVKLEDDSFNFLFSKDFSGNGISVSQLKELPEILGIGLVQIRMNKGTINLNSKQIELWNSVSKGNENYILFGSPNSAEKLKGSVCKTFDFTETCQKFVLDLVFI
ncbi:MAG: hypothetical protein DWQ06_05780 [Calditrichaeota bacterium]|nr:MAG: hypothetical protein DWQ06_05780 [Calditrichota bacterium]